MRSVLFFSSLFLLAGGCAWDSSHRNAYSSCMSGWDQAEREAVGPGGKAYFGGEEQSEYCWRYAQYVAAQSPLN